MVRTVRALADMGQSSDPAYKGFREYELGTRRQKHRHRDWHHVRHSGWRLSCDTIFRIGPIRRYPAMLR